MRMSVGNVRIAFVMAVACLIAAVAPAFAGVVEVNFVDADDFTDAAGVDGSNAAILGEIGAHLVDLGQRYLPPAQVLKVDVLDIDLAGYQDEKLGPNLRLVSPDYPPRIKLRFILEESGQILLQGEDKLTDPDYMRVLARPPSPDQLRFERPMLTRWFESRFVQRAPNG
jgi:hypothetical protein